MQILTEPMNSLLKQFQKLFAMEGAELDVRPEAMKAIARKALKRKTGARGLRSIIEAALLDTMYDLPSQGNVSRVVLDENVIESDGKPLLIYADEAAAPDKPARNQARGAARSEEHTSELQSLMRTSYAVFR